MLSTLSDLASEKEHEKTQSKLANIQLFVVQIFFSLKNSNSNKGLI